MVATAFLFLALLHFSPTVKYVIQNHLVGLDEKTIGGLKVILGEPFFIHDATNLETLALSVAFKSPTRYFRDVIFWSQLDYGEPFAATPEKQSPYGIDFVFFDPNSYHALYMSMPMRTSICIGQLKAWVVRETAENTPPIYALDEGEYMVSMVTDQSEKWKNIERPCLD